jgi:hypothetical protein
MCYVLPRQGPATQPSFLLGECQPKVYVMLTQLLHGTAGHMLCLTIIPTALNDRTHMNVYLMAYRVCFVARSYSHKKARSHHCLLAA